MKQIIISAFAIVGLFSFISCERHEWEDQGEEKGTKRLYPVQEHGHGGHDTHGDKKDHSGHEQADKKTKDSSAEAKDGHDGHQH
ncbi:hypothetical protein HW115_10505 [Verrucomicrobiaceae bacterium N1E253]|uniref:Uncharacterized protein n=1 Tax=Oceaniferula marina TaxID=2748318 RepID=A0A851GES9_9BACT|nr:hypothetical protein [Oceaniferula marina]NWK56043.1 hypothetical protein [Oceaniferula marina]